MNILAQINLKPMRSYQWFVIAMTAIMNMLDGFDVLALAFTASAIKEEFFLTSTALGYLLSAGLIGMALGSLFLAPLADRIGRRPLLLIAVAISALGMLAAAFAHNPTSLAIYRIITGIGVGGILVGGNILASEYASQKWRGVAISIFIAGYSLGAVLGGIFAVILQQYYDWRAVFLAGAILTAICFIILLCYLPESIDYLVNQRPHHFRQQLNKISQRLGITAYDLPCTTTTKSKANLTIQLFSPTFLKATLLLWFIFFSIMFAFYFVNFWTPTLLKEAGMTAQQSISVGIMISAGTVCGATSYGFFAIRWRANYVLMAFTLLAAMTMILFIMLSAQLALAMLIGVVLGFLINGCISGIYLLNTLIYPAKIRATGVGWAVGIGRMGAIIAPILAGALLDLGWQKQSLYIGVAIILVVTSLVILAMPKQHLSR
ncbi:MFS transporter [Volucribacter amazonae]|uniref:MFS transporter n=1 Tax=Volucribacter amazonae TaxID=256731 RepID=A0A9X4PNE1_9PAST|nr:MFS transporter [Volucribacter amazonae]MDG6894968.1 MFS transporter [Volucribacter amazonae]